MKSLVPAICGALLAATAARAAPAMDEWRYTPATPDAPATAEHLATDLRARCDKKRRELMVTFTIEAGLIDPPEVLLLPDDREWPMTVVVDGLKIEGRLPVSADFAHDIEQAMLIEIWVPTEMGEALHTGRADPLRRIVRDCAVG